MTPKTKSKKAAPVAKVSTASDASIQITAHRGGYLIKGDIGCNNPGLKDFATWNDELGAWYISKRRAYEYDHHYGLRLFGR